MDEDGYLWVVWGKEHLTVPIDVTSLTWGWWCWQNTASPWTHSQGGSHSPILLSCSFASRILGPCSHWEKAFVIRVSILFLCSMNEGWGTCMHVWRHQGFGADTYRWNMLQTFPLLWTDHTHHGRQSDVARASLIPHSNRQIEWEYLLEK